MKIVDRCAGSNWIIADSKNEIIEYLMFGNILNIFNKSRTISWPIIWGSSSSGYMAKIQLLAQIGDVFINIGCACP